MDCARRCNNRSTTNADSGYDSHQTDATGSHERTARCPVPSHSKQVPNASAPRSRDPYPHLFDRQSCCGQCVPSDVNPESPADTHSLSSPDRLQSNNSPYTETDNCSNTSNHSPDARPTVHRRTALSASSYDGNDK